MHLSDEQMRVVNAGFKAEQTQGWTILDLPIGPQPLPEWAKGLTACGHFDQSERKPIDD